MSNIFEKVLNRFFPKNESNSVDWLAEPNQPWDRLWCLEDRQEDVEDRLATLESYVYDSKSKAKRIKALTKKG